jgi:hypothetical protein
MYKKIVITCCLLGGISLLQAQQFFFDCINNDSDATVMVTLVDGKTIEIPAHTGCMLNIEIPEYVPDKEQMKRDKYLEKDVRSPISSFEKVVICAKPAEQIKEQSSIMAKRIFSFVGKPAKSELYKKGDTVYAIQGFDEYIVPESLKSMPNKNMTCLDIEGKKDKQGEVSHFDLHIVRS